MNNKTDKAPALRCEALVRCPTLCPECQKHIDSSNLHWVLCGGLCVGDYVQPKVWRLRDKDELLNVQRRTKDLQRIAGAMRYLCETLPHLPQELRAKVENFISPNKTGVPRLAGDAAKPNDMT